MLQGGDIWTLDANHPKAVAVAVAGDHIVAVGDAAAIAPYIGGATRVIDLHGHSVTPGLIDAHCHLYGLGADQEMVSLRDLASEDAAADALTAARGPWVFGRGWDQNRWPGQKLPTKASLDGRIKDRPVVLTRVDGHALWVNSVALRTAGITKATKDPSGGKIVRDAKGEATGVLIDNAMGLVVAKVPPASAEQRETRIRAAAAIAVASGLTAVHEMGIDADTAAVYRKLAAANQLPLRVVAYTAGDADHLDNLARPPAPPTGRFSMPGVKLYADGALGSRGARLYAGYTDDAKNQGLWRTPPDKLNHAVDVAVTNGWQVATHAIGDAAVGAVIDAYLAAEASHPVAGGHRLRVEHVQVIAAKDVPRLVAAHAIASMQPTHATSDMGWAEARLGPERVIGAYAWRTMLEHHVPFAAGSDFPVEQVSPILGLYAAVSRQNAKGEPAQGWYPSQRMTLLEAVDAFTHGAAFAEHAEDSRGAITVGRRADFTVFGGTLAADKSLLAQPIDFTIVDGQVVYERAAAPH